MIRAYILKSKFILLVSAIILTMMISRVVIAKSFSPLTNSLTQVSPVSCPSNGCAAGQRFNFQLGFNVSPVYSGGPNAQVCFYTPQSGGSGAPWGDASSFTIDAAGGATAQPYTAGETGSVCTANTPANSSLLGGAYATLPSGTTGDSLGFEFRINAATTVNGAVTAYTFEVNSAGTTWAATGAQPSQALNVAAASQSVFVATGATACGPLTPCYVDSADDLAGGIGTGLKDAVDASPSSATINIWGNYSTKSNAVVLNRPQTVQGATNSTLFGGGGTCSDPVLYITGGASLKNLAINGNACPSPGRNLVSINSADAVLIESNDLTSGNDAVNITNANNKVVVRFNQITSNAGYAIKRAANSGSGALLIVANNIFNNRSGAEVECNSQGQADHNFWGRGTLPNAAASNCTASNGKQLGALIQHNINAPGVNAHRLTVTSAKLDPLNQGLSLQHAPTDADFDVYTVNHGYGTPDQIPFYGEGTSYLSPCSSFWDLFLAEGASVPSNLSLYFKYNLNQSCVGVIESSSYCGQTADPARYPLWWFDPATNATTDWNTTGQNPNGLGAGGAPGQATSCLTSSKEILVSISPGGRPGLTTDLNYTPMVIGTMLPVTFISFNVTATIGQALLQWETASENNISGFYVVRSTQPTGTYSRTSNRIASNGSPVIGAIYSYQDANLVYGTTYYYKLEIIGANGETVGFYGPISAVTATATPTITPTSTVTQTPTRTMTPTITSTRTKTTIPTNTRTATTFYIVPTRTRTPYYVASITPSPLSLFTRTSTLAKSVTPGTGTPRVSGTPGTLTVSPSPGGLTSLTTTPTGPGSGYPVSTSTVPRLMVSGTFTTTRTLAAETQKPVGNMTLTAIAMTGTPLVTVTPEPNLFANGRQPWFWVTLIAGGVIGIALVGLLGWFFFQRRLASKPKSPTTA